MADERLDDLSRRIRDLEARVTGLSEEQATLSASVADVTAAAAFDSAASGDGAADAGDGDIDETADAKGREIAMAPPKGASQAAVDAAVDELERTREREENLVM